MREPSLSAPAAKFVRHECRQQRWSVCNSRLLTSRRCRVMRRRRGADRLRPPRALRQRVQCGAPDARRLDSTRLDSLVDSPPLARHRSSLCRPDAGRVAPSTRHPQIASAHSDGRRSAPQTRRTQRPTVFCPLACVCACVAAVDCVPLQPLDWDEPASSNDPMALPLPPAARRSLCVSFVWARFFEQRSESFLVSKGVSRPNRNRIQTTDQSGRKARQAKRVEKQSWLHLAKREQNGLRRLTHDQLGSAGGHACVIGLVGAVPLFRRRGEPGARASWPSAGSACRPLEACAPWRPSSPRGIAAAAEPRPARKDSIAEWNY